MEADFEYKFVYRNVKYPRLEFRTGKLLLILPNGQKPEDVIERHENWIRKKKELIEESLRETNSKKLINRSDHETRDFIQHLVYEISNELNVSINKIYFRKMKTKWASCSPKKNLTVNILVKYLPRNLIEYVIYHEITHLIERRHNESFWKIISKKFPNYDEMEKELFTYWFLIQKQR